MKNYHFFYTCFVGLTAKIGSIVFSFYCQVAGLFFIPSKGFSCLNRVHWPSLLCLAKSIF